MRGKLIIKVYTCQPWEWQFKKYFINMRNFRITVFLIKNITFVEIIGITSMRIILYAE